MFTKSVALALALSAAASAAPALRARQNACLDAYNACVAAGTPEVSCSCTLTTCSGEDSARIRDYCASATANLPQATSSGIPGGCNPAHPGSCPSSYFDTTIVAQPTPTSIPGGCNPAHPGSCPSSYFDTTQVAQPVTTSIPGGCNPAHPGSCPSSYFDTTQAAQPTPTSIPGGCNPAHPGSCPSSYFDTTIVAQPTPTSIPGGCNPAHPGSCPSSYFDTTKVAQPVTTSIPGGCNPAHPGSCPSSYFDTTMAPVATVTSIPGIPGGCNPAHPGSCPTPAAVASPIASAAPGSNPVLVSPAKSWTISNLTRYCGEDNSGCDYNFAVTADNKNETCTVVRMPGSNAATESWANQNCTTGSNLTISWGYVAQPAPAFAVITVVKGKELAWFGVSNINSGKVTASSPFGSGDFGTLPASPVYTY